MFSILWLCVSALPEALYATDDASGDPAKLSSTALLGEARQLTEEKYELTQYAAKKATKEKTKQFVRDFLPIAQKADLEMNDLAAAGSASAAEKSIPATDDEVTDAERLEGELFDAGYIKAMRHLSTLLIPVFEELATRGGTAKLKEFGREASRLERKQLAELDTFNLH